jgi:sigma-E factor negative regulatory protein RseC
MSSGNAIEHKGVVEAVSDDGIKVRFTSVSACAACHAKGVCSASDMEDKEITVNTASEDFQPGDPVMVTMASSLGTRAVLIGYVYPFILLLVVLMVLNQAGISELKSGVLSLATLLPYYFAVYLFRGKIERKFGFSIRKSL